MTEPAAEAQADTDVDEAPAPVLFIVAKYVRDMPAIIQGNGNCEKNDLVVVPDTGSANFAPVDKLEGCGKEKLASVLAGALRRPDLLPRDDAGGVKLADITAKDLAAAITGELTKLNAKRNQ